MPEWVTQYWITWVFGLIAAGMSVVCSFLVMKLKQEVVLRKSMESDIKELQGIKEALKEQTLIKRGMMAILHDRLYQACMFHIQTGEIGVSELKNLEYLYESYHSLGGNGTGTSLFESCKLLRKVSAGAYNAGTYIPTVWPGDKLKKS